MVQYMTPAFYTPVPSNMSQSYGRFRGGAVSNAVSIAKSKLGALAGRIRGLNRLYSASTYAGSSKVHMGTLPIGGLGAVGLGSKAISLGKRGFGVVKSSLRGIFGGSPVQRGLKIAGVGLGAPAVYSGFTGEPYVASAKRIGGVAVGYALGGLPAFLGGGIGATLKTGKDIGTGLYSRYVPDTLKNIPYTGGLPTTGEPMTPVFYTPTSPVNVSSTAPSVNISGGGGGGIPPELLLLLLGVGVGGYALGRRKKKKKKRNKKRKR